MEPSNLPIEIFNQVLDCETNRETRLRTLCCFSLVSRRWYTALSTHIYSRWLYDGEIHSISSLWKFLRSVLCNKGIAHEVRELNIRNWTFGLVHTHGCLALSESDLDLIRKAVHASELTHIEISILEALRKADPRPLMALLLANLPNLTTLYAHLPERDIFFAEVLRKAVATRQDESKGHPLCSLCEAHFSSAWNYRAERPDDEDDDLDDAINTYHLRLDQLWPIFQLSSIKKLSVFDFDTQGAAERLANSSKTSNITDLTLVHHEYCQLKPLDTFALLALPRVLTSLSIYLEDSRDLEHSLGVYNQLSNADLWNGIRQHEDSLERLDIYRDCTINQPPYHSGENSYFGSMCGFKALKYLSIQPEVLLGGCCGDDLAPFNLKDTLPPQLESITLYGEEGLVDMEDLGAQLQDVIASTNFRSLGCIALEDTPKVRNRYFRYPVLPHWEVYQACRKSGKRYEERPHSSCTKGGLGRRYYRYVVEKREQMEEKLVDIRFAVREYLIRMGKSTHDDGDFPVGVDDLSSEDLDTYELPWDELTRDKLYGDVDADRFFDFCGIDLATFDVADEEDEEDLTEQIDKYYKHRGELGSREHYFWWEDEFHWENPTVYDSDGVW